MSDFLLNVARRGAGLAPVVRARAPLPLAAAGAEEAGAPVADLDLPAPRVLDARPSVTGVPPSWRPAPPPAAEIDPPPPAAVAPFAAPGIAAPVVQRTPAASLAAVSATIAALAAPAPAPVPATLVAAPVPMAPVTAPRAPIIPSALAPEPRHTAVVVETPRLEPAPRPRRDDDAEPRSAPSPAVVAAVALPSPDWPRSVSIADAPEDDRAVVAVPVEPIVVATAADVRAPAPRELASPPDAGGPERVVHVRIGAIEIHAAPAPAASAAPAPPPPPAASTSAGFEEFTRLRSYAPWTR